MKNGLTPCLMTTAKTPWLYVLLYLVLSDTGTTVHVVNSLCFPARKDQTVKRHWIFMSTSKQARFARGRSARRDVRTSFIWFPGFDAVCDLHGLLPQWQISPVVRQIEARRCHHCIPKVLGSFLSIHEASQVDSSRRNSWVAAQSCWTSQLLASSADKPILVLADYLITANSHIPKLCA